MAKIAQLIEAGDYLVYKGDWVTNTAYNVNDVVTWTNGNLYEVIKAHTSSDTLKPGNTEYYKTMTKNKIIGKSFNTVQEVYNFIVYLDYERIGSLQVKTSGSFIKLNPQGSLKDFSSTTILNSDGTIRHTMLRFTWPNTVIAYYLDINIDGTRTITNFTPEKYTIYYEE